MEDFSFRWSGSGSLLDCLKGPFIQMSTPAKREEEIFSFKLWREDGRILVIHSEMHDLYDREEVGVLAFSEVSKPSENEREFKFEKLPYVVSEVMKITAHEDGRGNIECGIVLRSRGRQDITILAGSFPCSLAVKGVSGVSEKFEPEYPLERYQYEPWVA